MGVFGRKPSKGPHHKYRPQAVVPATDAPAHCWHKQGDPAYGSICCFCGTTYTNYWVRLPVADEGHGRFVYNCQETMQNPVLRTPCGARRGG